MPDGTVAQLNKAYGLIAKNAEAMDYLARKTHAEGVFIVNGDKKVQVDGKTVDYLIEVENRAVLGETFTLGHEMGHALYRILMDTDALTQAQKDALAKHFNENGVFHEEAFADAFGKSYAKAFVEAQEKLMDDGLKYVGISGKVRKALKVGADFIRTLAKMAMVWRKVQEQTQAQGLDASGALDAFLKMYGETNTTEERGERKAESGEATLDDGTRYSISGRERARWINTIIAAEKEGFNTDDFYRVTDKTFDVLQMLHDNGFPAIPGETRPLEIQGATIIKALQGKHHVPSKQLVMLLDTLDEPIAVFQSANRLDSVVFLTEMKENDNNVLVAIAMSKRKGSSSLVIDKITSIYGKESPTAIQEWVDDGLLMYVNKKKAASLPRIRRLQLPEERLKGVEPSYLTEEDLAKYRDNVAQQGDNVKYSIPNLYTGSRAPYSKPDISYVGSGTGATAEGFGLYSSNVRGVAESYTDHTEYILFRGVPIDFYYDDIDNRMNGKAVPAHKFSWMDEFFDFDSGEPRSYYGPVYVTKEGLERSKAREIMRVEGELAKVTQKLKENTGKKIQKRIKKHIRYLISTIEEIKDIKFEDFTYERSSVHEQTWWTHREPGDESHLLEWLHPISQENAERILKLLKENGLYDYRVDDFYPYYKLTNGNTGMLEGHSLGDLVSNAEIKGGAVYTMIADALESEKGIDSDEAWKETSQLLYKYDIDGVKYPVQYREGFYNYERGANYVAFSDEHLQVDHQWQWDGSRYEQKFSMPNMREDALRKRAQAEYDAVVAQYTNPDGTKKAGWMKAPNGEPTKLTERQWVQVRTPSFKRWFGDWELRYTEFEVVEAVLAPFNNVTDALTFAQQNGIIGLMSADETGGKGEINISIASVREMLNPSQRNKSVSNEAHFAVLTKLKEVIRESKIIESHPDYKKGPDGKRDPKYGVNNDISIDIAYGAIRIGENGEPYRVKTTLKRYADKASQTKAYAYEVTEIEVLTGNLVDLQKSTNPKASTSINGIILLNGVKNRNGNLVLEDHSKVVDENGEPRVVYHGTAWNPLKEKKGDAVFDISKLGDVTHNNGWYGRGFYFTISKSMAESYKKMAIESKAMDAGFPEHLKTKEIEQIIKKLNEGMNEDNLSDEEKQLLDEYQNAWSMSLYNEYKAKHKNDGSIVQAFLNIRDPEILNPMDVEYQNKPIKYILKQRTHESADGIIVGDGNEIVIEDPTQIKSATDNVGTFDGGNPDIRYSMPNLRNLSYVETQEGKQAVLEVVDELLRRAVDGKVTAENVVDGLYTDALREQYGLKGEKKREIEDYEQYIPKMFRNPGLGAEAYLHVMERVAEVMYRFNLMDGDTELNNALFRRIAQYVQNIGPKPGVTELDAAAFRFGREVGRDLQKRIEAAHLATLESGMC